jgi:hypothetical protein
MLNVKKYAYVFLLSVAIALVGSIMLYFTGFGCRMTSPPDVITCGIGIEEPVVIFAVSFVILLAISRFYKK